MSKTDALRNERPDPKRLSPLDALFPGGVLALFSIFSVTVVGALYVLIERHEAAELEQSMLRTAEITVQNISNFRAYYSSEILSNLEGTDVPVTHQFRDQPGALPLPATMSIELGDYLDSQGAEVRYRMFSDKPFPWRADRSLDRFEMDALATIAENPGQPVYAFQDVDGATTFRFVSAVRMEQSCVDCHNAHPDSPFRLWNVGDVRGVQEIFLPQTGSGIGGAVDTTFRDIILFVVAAFGSAALFILVLVRRNRTAFANLEELAAAQVERARLLERTQDRMEEGLGRLNAVLDNVADAIVTIDEAGRIESANPATEEIFGYPRSALIGENVSMLMPEAIGALHSRYIDNFRRTGRSKIIGVGRELEGRRADGSLFPLELSIGEVRLGGRVLFTGVMRDITERKKAEEDLRESERKSRTLSLVADRTDNAVIITDAAGLVEWVNEGFERISGYGFAEVKGLKPGEVLQGPDTDLSEIARIRRKIAAGEGFNAELVNYAKNGEAYWVQIDAQPIYGPDGTLEHYIAIERDVTETKRRESELDDARQRAEEGSATKSRFLAMMSHEIRTPLNGVLGALGLLEDGKLSREDLNLVRIGKKAGENLMAIINDVLDVSKMDADALALENSVMEPRQLAEDVIDVMRYRANEKGLSLSARFAPDLPECLIADPARLRQILINLVGNAIKFTTDGSVAVRVHIVERKEKRAVVRFDVEDTGAGIPADNLAHLFDEFWRAPDTKTKVIEGTGLGLTICRRLAELMDGEIEVSSEVGRGSVFSVTVPMGLPTPEEVAAYRDGTVEAVEPKEDEESFDNRILVAEDSSANQMIIRTMLERLGAHVDLVGDGREALEAVRSRPYDLVLMDINMPTMDGVEATQAIRALPGASSLPIVAMTAYTMKGDKENFLDEGLDDYIAKPIRRTELTAVLRRWLGACPPVDPARESVPEETSVGAVAATPLIDTSVLDELLEGIDREARFAVLDTFTKEFRTRRAALEAAFAQGDLDEVHRQAHALKGACSGLGAVRLSALLDPLQRDTDLSTIGARLRAVSSICEESESALRRYMEEAV
ncbi:MAG: PAS domain S-box protein [Alphaproteobacteria bacterium]|nr:PAS domain S-box protein [Alphaproteobacteria bacterium]